MKTITRSLPDARRAAKAEPLGVLDRLAPPAEGDDRNAKALKAQIEAKRKDLEGSQP
jgi:hypothetical protein